MGKTNNSNGVDYKDVRAFAKALGVNIGGKKRDKAILMVFDAIKANYEQAKAESSSKDFEAYKVRSQDMLAWFNTNRNWKPPAEKAKEDASIPAGGEPPVKEEEAEREKVVSEEETRGKPTVVETEGEPDAKIMDDSVMESVESKVKDKEKSAETKDRIKKTKSQVEKVKAGKGASKESSIGYIPRYRKMLENPNSIPSKIRDYIGKKGEISYGILKKACVKTIGCKSETAGTIGATIAVLKMDGLVKIEGKGESKRIISS